MAHRREMNSSDVNEPRSEKLALDVEDWEHKLDSREVREVALRQMSLAGGGPQRQATKEF